MDMKDSIAYCGLVCDFCMPGKCSCKNNNHCGKRLSKEGCYQYTCCKGKNIDGCWECDKAPCGRDMMAKEHVKIKAFVRCMKEDGVERFCEYLKRNRDNGVVYHRDGINGDYDLDSEEKVLKLLRTGK